MAFRLAQILEEGTQRAQASFGGKSWYREYQAAYGGGAGALANWMNTRAPSFSDWDQAGAEFASNGLAGLQDFESGSNAPFGINELRGAGEAVADFAATVVPPVLVVTAGIAGGEALLALTGPAAAGATLEAGAAGETATAIASEGAGLELFGASEAVNSSIGPGVELFSASEAGIASSGGIVDRLLSFGETQLEKLGMSKIAGVLSGGARAPRNSGAPALAKENYLPRGNFGAIYGLPYNEKVGDSAFGFGSGASSRGSTGASAVFTSPTFLAVALVTAFIGLYFLLRK